MESRNLPVFPESPLLNSLSKHRVLLSLVSTSPAASAMGANLPETRRDERLFRNHLLFRVCKLYTYNSSMLAVVLMPKDLEYQVGHPHKRVNQSHDWDLVTYSLYLGIQVVAIAASVFKQNICVYWKHLIYNRLCCLQEGHLARAWWHIHWDWLTRNLSPQLLGIDPFTSGKNHPSILSCRVVQKNTYTYTIIIF